MVYCRTNKSNSINYSKKVTLFLCLIIFIVLAVDTFATATAFITIMVTLAIFLQAIRHFAVAARLSAFIFSWFMRIIYDVRAIQTSTFVRAFTTSTMTLAIVFATFTFLATADFNSINIRFKTH